MADGVSPKDDNLRLIFSEQHGQWLDSRIAVTRRAIAVLAAIVGLGVVITAGASVLADGRHFVYLLFSAALTIIAAIELIRRIHGLRKYRRYTEDHQGFLKKYNRL